MNSKRMSPQGVFSGERFQTNRTTEGPFTRVDKDVFRNVKTR